MKLQLKKVAAIVITAVAIFGTSHHSLRAAETEYEIYPKPQAIKYNGQSFTISNKVNVVLERGVDNYTKKRLEKILTRSRIKFSFSRGIVPGITNILVGLNRSKGPVDKYFNQKVTHNDTFFDKNDAHIVSIKNNMVAVLGRDADSAFYGVTTLKHVFNQLKGRRLLQFRADDYCDVKHRGFIEGYYGNPWSNEDRAELMKFGGDYKLNTYFFAPKDDKYHNSKWRELYPAKELAEIRKLAKAGNESKCKYVYALHTFMHSPVRFDNEGNYQADLKIIKAKFTQLLKNDVRAFSILADDAGVPRQGPSTYVKLLIDLTAWLIEQKKTYPDLVTDIPFCPNDYMGNGTSAQLREVNKAPDSTSIIMTGGRIWGEVSEHFTSNFIKNVGSQGHKGRPSYLWINWPCSDNSKQHLIMGGNDTFLHPNVTPSNIQGIILNPMQQAEANKSALFAIADYGWNIWDNKQQADQNWFDSFKYMNHGTAKETKTSTALREICKHMINQNMDGRVRALQESVELAPKLQAFTKKLQDGTLKKGDSAELIQEFMTLKKAAAYYRKTTGNKRTQAQIIHWLNCWEDTTTAAISYLKCTEAVTDKNSDAIWKHFSTGQMAFEKSKTYKFRYVNHFEYAEVGVQHIVPFLKALGKHLNQIVAQIISPKSDNAASFTLTASCSKDISTRSGSLSTITDGNDTSGPSFARNPYNGPNRDGIPANAFIRIDLKKPGRVGVIKFIQAKGDKIDKASLEYSIEGKSWKTLTTFDNCSSTLNYDASGLQQRVKALRIKNLSQTRKWWQVKEFQVTPANKDKGFAAFTNIKKRLIVEGKLSEAKVLPAKAITLNSNQYIGLRLDRIKDLKAVDYATSTSNLSLQTSANAVEWQTIKGKQLPNARYIRLINKTPGRVTFNLNKFVVYSNEVTPMVLQKAYANTHGNSKPLLAVGGDFNSTTVFAGGFHEGNEIVYDLGQTILVDNLKYVILDTEVDHVRDAKFQLSIDGKNWKDIFSTSRKTDDANAKPQDNGYKHGSLSKGIIPISHAYLEGSKLNCKARYFRILSTKSYTSRWVRISEILINNGQYIKTTNNPTFTSKPIELKNHGPEKMFDGDLTTSYRPNTQKGKIKRGTVVYKLSAKTRLKKITIVQDGNTISKAKVSIRVGNNSWKPLGTLNKSLNQFSTGRYKQIFEIKIVWKGTAPTIYEIVTN